MLFYSSVKSEVQLGYHFRLRAPMVVLAAPRILLKVLQHSLVIRTYLISRPRIYDVMLQYYLSLSLTVVY